MKILILFFLSLFTAGCIGVPNDKFYCQDELGNPVEGALLVCMYQHTNDFPDGINYYLSDKNGIWHATNDKITRNSRSAPRGILFVYSEQLHSGCQGKGNYRRDLTDVNYYSVYAIREDHPEGPITVFKDGTRDPYVWMESLNYLHRLLDRTGISWGGNGNEIVQPMLQELYNKEVDSFIKIHGKIIVDAKYLTYYNKIYANYKHPHKLGAVFGDLITSKRPIQ